MVLFSVHCVLYNNIIIVIIYYSIYTMLYNYIVLLYYNIHIIDR